MRDQPARTTLVASSLGRTTWAPPRKRAGTTSAQNTTIRPPRGAASTLREKYDRMIKGTVKWFNSQKGYGFIAPETGGKDVFVHISAVERAGMDRLNEGQKVAFDVVADRNGRAAAENLHAA